MPLLIALALDKGIGREMAGGSVDDRTRSFATYGLGLMAYHHTKVELKKAAFDAMKELVNDKKMSKPQHQGMPRSTRSACSTSAARRTPRRL
jgi:hypothetical protein